MGLSEFLRSAFLSQVMIFIDGEYFEKRIRKKYHRWTLIAIDVHNKAYDQQYLEAVLVADDSDSMQVVKAMKETGAYVVGLLVLILKYRKN